MSVDESQGQPATSAPPEHELAKLQCYWWCFSLLGVAMLILGLSAVGSGAFLVTVLTVKVFGFLLLFGGVAQVISSFWAGQWSGFMLHLLIGVFYVVVGMMIVDNTEASTAAITLLIAAFLIVGGIFRVITALTIRFHDWGWVLLNGVVSVLLGLMIHESWPTSSFFVIGLFIGIELLFNGITWMMLGFQLRRLATTE